MKAVINVNRHKVKSNAKNGTDLPVISVKVGKSNIYCHGVKVNGPSELVYNPNKPLKCGARVWITADSNDVMPVIRGKFSIIPTVTRNRPYAGLRAINKMGFKEAVGHAAKVIRKALFVPFLTK